MPETIHSVDPGQLTRRGFFGWAGKAAAAALGATALEYADQHAPSSAEVAFQPNEVQWYQGLGGIPARLNLINPATQESCLYRVRPNPVPFAEALRFMAAQFGQLKAVEEYLNTCPTTIGITQATGIEGEYISDAHQLVFSIDYCQQFLNASHNDQAERLSYVPIHEGIHMIQKITQKHVVWKWGTNILSAAATTESLVPIVREAASKEYSRQTFLRKAGTGVIGAALALIAPRLHIWKTGNVRSSTLNYPDEQEAYALAESLAEAYHQQAPQVYNPFFEFNLDMGGNT